jgi:hypothetical protein
VVVGVVLLLFVRPVENTWIESYALAHRFYGGTKVRNIVDLAMGKWDNLMMKNWTRRKGIGQMIFIVSRKDAESAKGYSIIYFAVFGFLRGKVTFNYLLFLWNIWSDTKTIG